MKVPSHGFVPPVFCHSANLNGGSSVTHFHGNRIFSNWSHEWNGGHGNPTPPKFNMVLEKLWLEDYFPIGAR